MFYVNEHIKTAWKAGQADANILSCLILSILNVWKPANQ